MMTDGEKRKRKEDRKISIRYILKDSEDGKGIL